MDSLPAFVYDSSLDAKKRSKLIEKEMNEQAKIINDLRSLGASHGTIEQEMKRLHELETMVFKDFRRYESIVLCKNLAMSVWKVSILVLQQRTNLPPLNLPLRTRCDLEVNIGRVGVKIWNDGM